MGTAGGNRALASNPAGGGVDVGTTGYLPGLGITGHLLRLPPFDLPGMCGKKLDINDTAHKTERYGRMV